MSRLSTVRSVTSRPTGIIMAPPIPCSTLLAVKLHSPVLSPQSADAMVNRAIAPANTPRAPKRSTIQPLTGMNTAAASI